MAEIVKENGEIIEVPTAIVPVAPQPPATRALITREAIAEEAEQRQILAAYVREQMVPDVDFGVIPGTQKPTLLKPGAEKLTELFRCTAEFELTHKVEDWDKPLFHYAYTCRIRHRATGTVVAEGVGSCNSFEDRYRYRNAKRSCPACGKESVIKGRAEFGGGWLCWKKEGKSDGCGAKFRDGDQEIEGQVAGKVANEDIHSQVNTIMKMAKKRAHVDAGIALGRVSDIFTQDMEDHPSQPKPAKPAPRPADQPKAQTSGPVVDAQQLKIIRTLCATLKNAGDEHVKENMTRWLGVQSAEEIPASRFEEVQTELQRQIQRRMAGAKA